MTTQSFDVLVVGAGVVGLSAALAMAQRDYKVAVIDAGSITVDLTTPDARVYAINDASKALLEALHVWMHLDLERLSPYDKMFVWDAVNGAHIDFDSRAIAKSCLGTIIEESVLKQALLQEIYTKATICLFADSLVDAVLCSNDGVRVSCQDRSWDGKLLMVADGANSPTRQQLQVDLTTWSYNQKALVATINVEKPHEGTAYQVFNADGPLAFLPLKNPQQCSIVWTNTPERIDSLMALDEETFNQELAQAFAEKLGKVQVAGKRYQFPLQMRHAKQYAGNNWLLLGDAAHTIHPLAGLGLNVGLADVQSFIHCLDTSKTRTFSPRQLAAYQRERKHAVWQTIALMEGFKRLFATTFKPIKALRGFGLQLCNTIKPLKRLFILHAAGREY